MLMDCRFGIHTFNCSEYFNTVLTDDGLCCNFNALHPSFRFKEPYNLVDDFETPMLEYTSNWSPEDGFFNISSKNDLDGSPRSSVGTGPLSGLIVSMSTNVEEYYCALSTSYGFKVLVHTPDEIPSVVIQGMAISNGFETDMVVTPIITESGNSVRRIQRTIRQCLFQNENFLTFYG